MENLSGDSNMSTPRRIVDTWVRDALNRVGHNNVAIPISRRFFGVFNHMTVRDMGPALRLECKRHVGLHEMARDALREVFGSQDFNTRDGKWLVRSCIMALRLRAPSIPPRKALLYPHYEKAYDRYHGTTVTPLTMSPNVQPAELNLETMCVVWRGLMA